MPEYALCSLFLLILMVYNAVEAISECSDGYETGGLQGLICYKLVKNDANFAVGKATCKRDGGHLMLSGSPGIFLCLRPPNCRTTVRGMEYNGTINRTFMGYECRHWSQMNGTTYSNMYPENYCRNPDGSDRIWCFTTDKDDEWDYCDAPMCDGTAEFDPQTGCRKTQIGMEYLGTASTTKTGKICQRWDSQYPHSHNYRHPYLFPERDVSKAGNTCRNPDGKEGGPWCFTVENGTKWEYCDIPLCC